MSSRRRRLRRKGTGSSTALRVLALMAGALLVLTVIGGIAAYAVVQSWLKDLPDYTAKGAFNVAQPTRIYSADGKLLARLYLENRESVPMSQISSDLAHAVVAVEDERFYRHHGVDPYGIIRAFVTNARAGDTRQGASTITQQYVRNTILLDERTVQTMARKIREAYLAMMLEKRYSKDEILAMYLNTVYFGEGAYGVESASQTYFAKHANELTLSQAALVAGLPQSPSRLNPYENLDGAVRRRNEVLARMLYNQYITQDAYNAALAEPVHLKRFSDPMDGIYDAPYYVAHVKKLLQQQFSPAVVFKGGLTVQTTLDTRLQGYAEKAAYAKLSSPSAPEAALVSIDPRNGYVKALVGGRDYGQNKFNLATQGRRQPGSSFKTFVLVTALSKGMPPSFMIDSSSPAVIPTKPEPWIVSNSEGSGKGMMTLRSATHLSVNTVFARVAWEIGAKDIAKTATAMGIETPLPNYPSIALGTRNVTPLEMASAYGTLATGGVHYDPVFITKVTDRDGKALFEAKAQGKRVVPADIAAATTDVLKGVITQGTATRANIGRPAAGKTGTSQDHRDVWFVGYTPQLVTSVWVGYRTERTIVLNGSRAFGGTVCAPIWATFMKQALAGVAVANFPSAPSPTYTPSKFHIPVTKPPAVTGMLLSAATEKLKGYTYTVEYAASPKPKGTILAIKMKNGKLVLTVSSGPAAVTPPPTTEPTGTSPPPGTP